MKTRIQTVLLLVILVGACENHQLNFDKQIKICEAAERNGILATAVNACEKALDIVESGDLLSASKSQVLYRLGRLKRQQGKFTEAEELLTQSLGFEEQQDKPNNLEIGRRLLELSLCMAGQNRWEEGVHVLRRLLPVIDQFSEKERLMAGNILKRYAAQLKQASQPELAAEFETSAIKIKKADSNK